jgi:hypothetical protein
MTHYDLIPRVHEMTPFTDCENDELLLFHKIIAGRGVVPIGPAETSIKELQAPTDRKNYPLTTATEAILLNDMFASFLSSGKTGHVIAVSGGFGAGGVYHIVGAGNTGMEGVGRPSNELCTALESACKEFISGNAMPLNPDNMSAILVASLDICHAEVAPRLRRINEASSNTDALDEQGLQVYNNFRSVVAALENNLKRWKRLEPQEKIEVATGYGRLLEFTSELWDTIINFGPIQSHRQLKPFHELNTITKGLQLLRKFSRGTRVVIDWPQGPINDPINGDRFLCQPATWQTLIEDLINKSAIGDHELRNKMRRMWQEAVGRTQWTKTILHAECRLHCEIYLALHILFSGSNVRFHAFRVEERKRVFTIGCSKESCTSCWDILRGLFRQDSSSHPIYVCRTRRSSGKCYPTWGLTPHLETLPRSLRQAVTGTRQTQMINAINYALKYSHQEFKQRVESFM